jgi:hypothetical protein
MPAKSARERKQDQRDRENAAIAKLGGRRIQFLVYGGTMQKLEAICKAQGFTGKQRKGEALTYLIENYVL